MEQNDSILEKATEAVEDAAQEGFRAAARISRKAERALHETGETVREGLSAAEEAVTSTAREAGRALTRKARRAAQFGPIPEGGVRGAIRDVEILVRRYPLQSLCIGFGVGYALSRLHRR